MGKGYTVSNDDIALTNSTGNKKEADDNEKGAYDNVVYVDDAQDGQTSATEKRNHAVVGDASGVSNHNNSNDNTNGCSRAVGVIQNKVSHAIKSHASVLRILFYIVLVLAYFAYFAYAMYYRFGDEGSWRLMIITVIVSLILFTKLSWALIRSRRQPDAQSCTSFKNFYSAFDKVATKIRLAMILPILLAVGLLVYVIIDIAIDNPRNIISLGGMIFYILFCYILSFSPSQVKWRPVFWGMSLQLIFALLILRTSWGREAFQWLGDRVTEFLAYTDAGSKFVFGDLYTNHFFAFKVLPVVVYFSTFVSILYYLGVMQVVISLLGRFLAFCLGTSPTESVNAAGNIFIGQTEAPLMIRPFLKDMTNSEIHAVMTGGFATIAGSVMAAYILYHVPANHLLSASVMSAPAALAMAKLFYPETEQTRHKPEDVYNIASGEERNLIEAASNGASMSIKLVANIAVNLIAFVALLNFVNATLVWLGDRVGFDELTFQFICSYIFWPLAFLMGVDHEDCRAVAELVGTKTFLNEFVAYVDLAVYIDNREYLNEYLKNATANITGNWTGNWVNIGNDIYLNDTGTTLVKGLISTRSVVIATYALCGFANLSSMGVQLGALGAMAPNRKGDMSKIVFRAMVAGNIACFMTACIAGLFYEDGV